MTSSATSPHHATGNTRLPVPAWHALSAAEAVAHLGLASVATGLSTVEAKSRLQDFGPNTLAAREGRSWLAAFGSQLAAVLVWLLLVAAAVSAVLGEWIDAGAIATIVGINAVISASQEHSAERSIAALRGMTAPKARVVRDGVVAVVPGAEVVPGDVLVLEAGDLVAADARLVESASLSAIEKSLTGESEPAEKDARAISPPPPANTPLAERRGMVYTGTAISTGAARAVVVATGMNTEMGRIAALIATAESDGPTPLQARLARVGRMLVVAALVIVAGLKFLERMPNVGGVHFNLASAFMEVGDFQKAGESFARAVDLLPAGAGMAQRARELQQECQRLVLLDSRLLGILNGSEHPASSDEGIQFAQLCLRKKLNAAAGRLFADAFASAPELADDLNTGFRYNAACAAARAGCSPGEAGLNEADRAMWRARSRHWLRADLDAWMKAPINTPAQRESIRRVLTHWQQDSHLAGLRDSDSLAKLLLSERDECAAIWTDVATALTRSQDRP